MKILVTSTGKSGSWKIRGEQLGTAIGAEVINNATDNQIKNADVCIFVKSKTHNFNLAKNSVFDTVDCWHQPSTGNYLNEVLEKCRPFNHVIAATAKMQQDIKANFYLRHHYRDGLQVNQIRNAVRTVGYEGRECYLGEWRTAIEQQCRLRRWRFVVNPTNINECDILLAVRGRKWRDYPTDNWKSGIKFSNAIGSCIPFLALPESGYKEYGLPFETVNNTLDINNAFNNLTDFKVRELMAKSYLDQRKHYNIETIAEEYSQWLASRF